MVTPTGRSTRPRRDVACATIDDVLADLEAIVSAEHSGRLKATGGWTPAQICQHLASFIEFSYDGFPFRASWPVRGGAHLAKWLAWKRFVDWSLQPGYKLPARFAALAPEPKADCKQRLSASAAATRCDSQARLKARSHTINGYPHTCGTRSCI